MSKFSFKPAVPKTPSFSYDPMNEVFQRAPSGKISATLGNDFKFGQSGIADAPAFGGTQLTTPGAGFSTIDPNMQGTMDSWGSAPGLANTGTDILGKWTQGAKLAVDVAGIGLGIFDAFQQKKMNKFMRDYYQDTMRVQKADFNNQATAANESLAARQSRLYDAMGMGVRGSAENEAAVNEYMSKWGAKTI